MPVFAHNCNTLVSPALSSGNPAGRSDRKQSSETAKRPSQARFATCPIATFVEHVHAPEDERTSDLVCRAPALPATVISTFLAEYQRLGVVTGSALCPGVLVQDPVLERKDIPTYPVFIRSKLLSRLQSRTRPSAVMVLEDDAT